MNKIKLYSVLMSLAAVLSASPVDMMIGSRGYGMGGAYVALADDPSAAYWNPAGLSKIDEISIMESNWIMQDIDGLNLNYLTAAFPIKHIGTISGSWLFAHATLEEGWNYADNKPGTTQSGNEHTFSLSLGRRLWDKLLIFENTSLGFSINRHAFTSDEENGAGLGFDLGFRTDFPFGISYGLMWRALGTDFMGAKIDPELRLGLGYSILIREMHRITAAVDGVFKRNRDYSSESTWEPAGTNEKAHGGLEYAVVLKDLDMEIAVRGGAFGTRYNTLNTYSYTLGLGFTYRSYSIQYAFKGDTYKDVGLGFGHRLSLILGLGDLIKFSGGKSSAAKKSKTEPAPITSRQQEKEAAPSVQETETAEALQSGAHAASEVNLTGNDL